VTDHLLRARDMYAITWLEPMATLSFAASITERVTLGPGVLLLPLRNPAVLAKEIATLQALSENRFIFGVGTGHYAPELAAAGAKISERGKRTDEVLELVKRLVAGEAVTYQGAHFKLDDVTIEPSTRPLPVVGRWRQPDCAFGLSGEADLASQCGQEDRTLRRRTPSRANSRTPVHRPRAGGDNR